MASRGNIVLDPAKRDIRILHIRPGSRGSPLEATISKCSLDAPQEYTALSYAWGSPVFTSTVRILNGDSSATEIPITQNLADALDHIRDEATEITMWVDAICIDQSDVVEKSHQVRLMRHIYHKSSHVLVWLGSESANSNRAMDEIKLLTDLDWRNGLDWSLFDTHAIEQLLCRPWFSRAWVRQEVKMAPPGCCSVRCGHQMFSVHILKRFIEKFYEVYLRDIDGTVQQRWRELGLNGGGLVSLMMCLHDDESESLDLTHWLLSSQFLEASDPRDLIFALLGLTTEAEELEPLVDYSRSISDVLVLLANHILHRSQNLELLSYTQVQHQELALPSWVPDWTPIWVPDWTSKSKPATLPSIHLSLEHYNACGNTQMRFSLSEDMRMLILEGFEFSRVAAIGRPGGEIHDLRHWLSDWEPLVENAQSRELYSKARTFTREAFWRTLVADLCNGADDRFWKMRWPEDDTGLAFRILRKEIEEPASMQLNMQGADISLDSFCRSTVYSRHRRFVVSDQGHVGLAPADVEVGDVIAVLYGGRVPYILREDASGCWRLIGEAYVHGIMDGEALSCESASKRSFAII